MSLRLWNILSSEISAYVCRPIRFQQPQKRRECWALPWLMPVILETQEAEIRRIEV
jgi:hypothetical protein